MDDDVSEERPLLPAADSWDDLRVPQVEDEADRWAWLADRHDVAAPPDLSRCRVTAVLVTLDAEAWLPETLAGLSRLTHKPTRLIAVDNGSTDNDRRAARTGRAARTAGRRRQRPAPGWLRSRGRRGPGRRAPR